MSRIPVTSCGTCRKVIGGGGAAGGDPCRCNDVKSMSSFEETDNAMGASASAAGGPTKNVFISASRGFGPFQFSRISSIDISPTTKLLPEGLIGSTETPNTVLLNDIQKAIEGKGNVLESNALTLMYNIYIFFIHIIDQAHDFLGESFNINETNIEYFKSWQGENFTNETSCLFKKWENIVNTIYSGSGVNQTRCNEVMDSLISEYVISFLKGKLNINWVSEDLVGEVLNCVETRKKLMGMGITYYFEESSNLKTAASTKPSKRTGSAAPASMCREDLLEGLTRIDLSVSKWDAASITKVPPGTIVLKNSNLIPTANYPMFGGLYTFTNGTSDGDDILTATSNLTGNAVTFSIASNENPKQKELSLNKIAGTCGMSRIRGIGKDVGLPHKVVYYNSNTNENITITPNTFSSLPPKNQAECKAILAASKTFTDASQIYAASFTKEPLRLVLLTIDKLARQQCLAMGVTSSFLTQKTKGILTTNDIRTITLTNDQLKKRFNVFQTIRVNIQKLRTLIASELDSFLNKLLETYGKSTTAKEYFILMKGLQMLNEIGNKIERTFHEIETQPNPTIEDLKLLPENIDDYINIHLLRLREINNELIDIDEEVSSALKSITSLRDVRKFVESVETIKQFVLNTQTFCQGSREVNAYVAAACVLALEARGDEYTTIQHILAEMTGITGSGDETLTLYGLKKRMYDSRVLGSIATSYFTGIDESRKLKSNTAPILSYTPDSRSNEKYVKHYDTYLKRFKEWFLTIYQRILAGNDTELRPLISYHSYPLKYDKSKWVPTPLIDSKTEQHRNYILSENNATLLPTKKISEEHLETILDYIFLIMGLHHYSLGVTNFLDLKDKIYQDIQTYLFGDEAGCELAAVSSSSSASMVAPASLTAVGGAGGSSAASSSSMSVAATGGGGSNGGAASDSCPDEEIEPPIRSTEDLINAIRMRIGIIATPKGISTAGGFSSAASSGGGGSTTSTAAPSAFSSGSSMNEGVNNNLYTGGYRKTRTRRHRNRRSRRRYHTNPKQRRTIRHRHKRTVNQPRHKNDMPIAE